MPRTNAIACLLGMLSINLLPVVSQAEPLPIGEYYEPWVSELRSLGDDVNKLDEAGDVSGDVSDYAKAVAAWENEESGYLLDTTVPERLARINRQLQDTVAMGLALNKLLLPHSVGAFIEADAFVNAIALELGQQIHLIVSTQSLSSVNPTILPDGTVVKDWENLGATGKTVESLLKFPSKVIEAGELQVPGGKITTDAIDLGLRENEFEKLISADKLDVEKLVHAGLEIDKGAVVLSTGIVDGVGGTISGNGTIDGPVSALGGLISPGDSPGHLTFDGPFEISSGEILMQIAGVGDDQYDRITFGGTTAFDGGEIVITDLNGFDPEAGLKLQLFDGQAPFDFSKMKVLFQFGSGIGGDLDTNGVVTFGGSSTRSSVPEPSALPLLLAGVGMIWGIRSRARRGGN